MNLKTGKPSVAIVLAAVVLVVLAQPAHAQQLTARYDRASYVPGDSGTLTITIVNNSPTDTVEIRNLTVYFPWAQLVDGKWPGGANVSVNFSPWKTLGSSNSGSNTYITSFGFTTPTWYSGNLFGGGGNCPNPFGARYGYYSGCILVGITANPPRYDTQNFGISMAIATYNPTVLTSQWIPIATLVALGLTTLFMAMTWTNLRKVPKPA